MATDTSASATQALATMSIEQAEHLGTQKVSELLKLSNLTKKDKDGNVTDEAKTINNTISATTDLISTYGIRQEIITSNKHEDARITAQRKLNDNCKPIETIEVECIGDTMYKVGYGVHVILPFLPAYQDCFMFIKEISNEWKENGIFISTLTLTPSRIMDIQEWTDDTEDEGTTGSTSGTDLANKIIALLKQQIGKPYVYGAKGADSFDCSGLVYYCYNQFKDELIDGKPMGGDTYAQVVQGIEVDKTNKDAWQPADLLFWIGEDTPPSHVSVYLGNGQMIHAPHTGKNVEIVAISRTDIYAVRRVVPEQTITDSTTNSGNVDLSNATQMTMELSFYTGAEDEGGSESASGKPLAYGMCASNVYPFGTKFYIKGINGLNALNDGVFTVEDRGGTDFYSANRLDIYIGNGSDAKTKANNLGRQTCTAYKLDSTSSSRMVQD